MLLGWERGWRKVGQVGWSEQGGGVRQVRLEGLQATGRGFSFNLSVVRGSGSLFLLNRS